MMTTPENMSTKPAYAIDIQQLSKHYPGTKKTGGKTALDAVNLQVKPGAIFGLLGPNGAGKSTLINIIAGLVKKNAGTIAVWGNDLDRQEMACRRMVGVVTQELTIDPFFTPIEALEIQAGLYGVPRRNRQTKAILEAMGLLDKAHSYARSLSGGMRRRLMVAKALVHNPPILILDEPTAGVDVALRQQLWRYVRHLNKEGTTIILTTHYLEEAEELCDRIAIINHGKIVACEDKASLLQRIDHKTARITLAQKLSKTLTQDKVLADQGVVIEEDDQALRLDYHPQSSQLSDLLMWLQDKQVAIHDIDTQKTRLEDVFLRLTES